MNESTEALRGRTVVLARSEDKADDLKRALEAEEAVVVVVPVIRHAPAGDPRELERVVRERLTFSHVAFTSQTAVKFFCEGTQRAGADAQAWRGVRIAAVGPQTAREIEKRGLPVAVVGSGGGAPLARELLEKEGVKRLKRVLIPQSAIAKRDLREALEAQGVPVEVLTVYETLLEAPGAAEPFLAQLRSGLRPDLVYFASPSELGGFLDLCGEEGRRLLEAQPPRAVAIGCTTAAAIREAGLAVAGETGTASVEEAVSRMASMVAGRPLHTAPHGA